MLHIVSSVLVISGRLVLGNIALHDISSDSMLINIFLDEVS